MFLYMVLFCFEKKELVHLPFFLCLYSFSNWSRISKVFQTPKVQPLCAPESPRGVGSKRLSMLW